MYDRLMSPVLRRCLVAAGAVLLLGGALSLEGMPEMLLIASGILLMGGGLQLYLVHHRHSRIGVTTREKELVDAMTRINALFCEVVDVSLAQPLKGIMASIDQIGNRVLKNHACALYDTTDGFKVLHVRGVSSELSEAIQLSYEQGSGLFHRMGSGVTPVSECMHDKRLKAMRARLDAERHRSLLFVPLLSEGRVLGFAFLFYNRPHSFSSEDIIVAAAFGSLVATVIRNGVIRHELERTHQQLRTWSDNSSEVMWILDPALQCRMLSRRGEEITGRSRAEWMGRSFVELVARSDRELFREKATAALSGRPQVFDLGLGAGDRAVSLSVRTAALYADGDVVAVLCAGKERTDSQKDGKAASSTQGAYGFGPLASGVARILGNSLTSILCRASLLKAAVEEQSQEGRHVDAINTSAQSIGRLLDGLLSYTHGYPKARETFDLNPLTRETVSLIEYGLDPAVEVRVDLHSEALPMAGDPAEVQRVIAMLTENAVEAIGESGTIWIRTLRGALDEQLARALDMNPGRCIVLGIRDTGEWPDIDVLERALGADDDPGRQEVGLCRRVSVANGIVKRLGGAMRISSVQGQGATFSVYLPFDTRGGLRELSVEPARVPPESHQDATVLVVSDDPQMLDLVSIAMKEAGYATIPVPHVSDVPGAVDSDLRDIDVAIVDLGGPRSGGLHDAQRLISRTDHLPVIALRDCSHDIRGLVGGGLGITAVLRKPFVLEELLQEVHQALYGRDRIAEDPL